ncbi:tetratricopeptide repeat protein, partial [Streptomyces sp. NPDC003328]
SQTTLDGSRTSTLATSAGPSTSWMWSGASPEARAGSGQSAMVVAAALHGLGRRDEAEMMARQAVDECEQFLHPTHPRIREARDLLAQITAGDPPPEAPDAGAGSS